MTKKLLFLAVAFCTLTTTAQYTTPNNNVNWRLDDLMLHAPAGVISLSDGVYTLSQNLTIAESDTFTIDENTLLDINPDVQITIAGTLTADADMIWITSSVDDNTHPFGAIVFEENATGYLRNVRIDRGKGIVVGTADFEMQNCSMTYHNKVPATYGTLTFLKGSPLVNGSDFIKNYVPAFVTKANATPTLSNNYLEQNTLLNSPRPQIELAQNTNDTIHVINNVIVGHPMMTQVGGILVSAPLGETSNFVIDGNTIRGNRYGISISGANASGHIRNNIIEDNDIHFNPAIAGSGILLEATGAPTMSITASGNQIRRNLRGITLTGQARIDLGHSDGPAIIGGGNIFAENIGEGNNYALYNDTPHPVSALFNCWIEGVLATPEQVESVIVHQVDNAALGPVDFTAFSELCTLGTTAFENHTFQIHPNPTDGKFTIAIDQHASVEIYNTSGQLLLTKTLDAGENSMELNAPTGIYLLKVITDSGITTCKIIKR